MEIGKIIKLENRYSDCNLIELVWKISNLFVFKVIPDPKSANHWRIVGSDNKEFTYIEPNAIDPSGGPFISVGNVDIIPGFTLVKIYWLKDYYLVFKQNEEEN